MGQLRLPEEGVTVLGIEQAEGAWVGAPSPYLQLCAGDVVVIYGRKPILDDVANRLHGPEGEQSSERYRAWHAASPPHEPLPHHRGRRGGRP